MVVLFYRGYWDIYQSSWSTKRLNLERGAVSIMTQKFVWGINHINNVILIYYTEK